MNGIQESQKSESAPGVSRLTGIGLKKCSKCDKSKSKEYFYPDPQTATGLKSQCKDCAREGKRKWHYANKEKRKQQISDWKEKNKKAYKEYQKNWKKNNPEKDAEHKKKWRSKNKQKIKIWKRVYRQNNKEFLKVKAQEWRAKNPEKIAAKNHKRRVALKEGSGIHTAEDIKNIFDQQGGLCNVCGKKLIRYHKKQYHVDHIIPLSKGGSNNPDNIQLLCIFCNSSKNNKDPKQWARENGRLF